MHEAQVGGRQGDDAGSSVARPAANGSLRAPVLEAFRRLGVVDWLVEHGQKQPKVFAGLLERLIRTQAEEEKGDDLELLARRLIELGRTPCDPVSMQESESGDATGSVEQCF